MDLKPTKGDDTGMQTRVWGPAGWLFLHCIAQNYPWEPTIEQKKYYLNFFKLVGNVLPCRYCRESYQQFIKESDTMLNNKIVESRKTLVAWLYLIHNKVNAKLDVSNTPSLKEVTDRYESYRSKCKKSPEKQKVVKKGCLDPLKGLRKRCFINIESVDSDGNKFGLNNNNKVKNKRIRGIKLISIKKSTSSIKKFTATFEINGRKKITQFGAKDMSDYLHHHDILRRKRYYLRHSKDLNTNNPAKAGFLSMFILWNKPTLQGSIADYRRRLGIYNRTGKFPKKIN
jgi:hypothetical protein